MHWQTNPIEDLARSIRRGEAGAAGEFRRQVTPTLAGLAGIALRKPAGTNVFEKHVQLCAADLQRQADGPLPRELLVHRLARQLCDYMIGLLEAGGRVQDTVLFARAANAVAPPAEPVPVAHDYETCVAK